MNSQKDNTNNTKENIPTSATYRDTVSNYYGVLDHEVYVSLAKRSQKIVTALYMVTDFLAELDPMRGLVRNEITTSMQNLFDLMHNDKTKRVEILSQVHNKLYAVISYLEVIYRNGFVSEMNYSVVVGELQKLRDDIHLQITKSLPYDKKSNNNQGVQEFSFADSFFENSKTDSVEKNTSLKMPQERSNQKDTAANAIDIKKTQQDATVFVPKKTSYSVPAHITEKIQKGLAKKALKDERKARKKEVKPNAAKQERKDNILKILKQKKDASINDICALFKDCSSKTIQRDLIELINEGMVKKEGSRRWSKYNLNY